ncbi:hypothetical protein AMTR_s00003p00266840 [Amborella trichopoda]|uniref:Uncharacterized protein n=1 Tax=Amborella trichopoda TaxID=13333 RepID=W1P6Z8_AMBTC|nr:hypothetical protein AMTR_s00003p00266840 [Amborella trichopoda]
MHCRSIVAPTTLLSEHIHRVLDRNVSKRCTVGARSRNAGTNLSTVGANYHTVGALWLQKVYYQRECLYRWSAFLYHQSDIINRRSALAPEGLFPERVFISP